MRDAVLLHAVWNPVACTLCTSLGWAMYRLEDSSYTVPGMERVTTWIYTHDLEAGDGLRLQRLQDFVSATFSPSVAEERHAGIVLRPRENAYLVCSKCCPHRDKTMSMCKSQGLLT